MPELSISECPSNTKKDIDLEVADLYRRARARTGVVVPELEKYLNLQPYDSEPAKKLLEKYENQAYPVTVQFGGARLEIDEGVFCPTFTSASPLLLDSISFPAKGRMLDAFAGSGAFGVNAALHQMDVVAYDISPDAVACAKKNATLNNMAERMDIRLGSIECIKPNERFDLITANPPLVPLAPGTGLESALFDSGLRATKDFITALPHLLAAKGQCYLLTSDIITRNGYKFDVASLCQEVGLKEVVVTQLHKQHESYRVHRISRRRWPYLRHLMTDRLCRGALNYEYTPNLHPDKTRP